MSKSPSRPAAQSNSSRNALRVSPTRIRPQASQSTSVALPLVSDSSQPSTIVTARNDRTEADLDRIAAQFRITRAKQRVVSAFKQYSRDLKQHRNRQVALACKAEFFRLQTVWTGWRRVLKYIEKCHLDEYRADSNFRHLLLRSTLQQWRLRLRDARLDQRKFGAALAHWSYSLQTKTFNQWKSYVHHRRLHNAQNRRAAAMCRHVLTRRYLYSWMSAFLQRKRQNLNLQTAVLCERRHVLQNALSKWRSALRFRRRFARVFRPIRDMLELQSLHSAMQQWKQFVLIAREENLLEAALHKAHFYHEARLRRQCIQQWRAAVTYQQRERLNCTQIAQKSDKNLTRVAFGLWFACYQTRRRSKQLPLRDQLPESSSSTTTITLVESSHVDGEHAELLDDELNESVDLSNGTISAHLLQLRNRQQQKLQLAHVWFDRKLLTAAFSVWRHQLRSKQHDAWLDSAALKFRRRYDLLNAIRALQNNAESALQRQITNRLAYRHYRRTLLIRQFGEWKQFVSDCKQSDVFDRIALKFQRHSRLRRGLAAFRQSVLIATQQQHAQRQVQLRKLYSAMVTWRHNARQSVQFELLRRKSQRFWYFHQLKHAVSQWKRCYRQSVNVDNELDETLQAKWFKPILKQTFATWRSAFQLSRLRLLQYRIAVARDRRALLTQTFAHWHHSLIVHRQHKRMQHLAISTSQKFVMRMAWFKWQQHFQKSREQDVDIFESARRQLNTAIRRRLFIAWHTAYLRSCRQSLQMRIALQQYRTSALRRYVINWRRWHTEHHHRTSIGTSITNSANLSVLSSSFSRWRSAYQLRRTELHRQVMALQHWSLQVHTRAFRAWQQYVQQRKAKQIRYQQARAARVDKLRTSGVQTWLQTANQIRSQRLQVAQLNATSRAQRIFQLVARLAHRWRLVARQRALQRAACQTNATSSLSHSSAQISMLDQFAHALPRVSVPLPQISLPVVLSAPSRFSDDTNPTIYSERPLSSVQVLDEWDGLRAKRSRISAVVANDNTFVDLTHQAACSEQIKTTVKTESNCDVLQPRVTQSVPVHTVKPTSAADLTMIESRLQRLASIGDVRHALKLQLRELERSDVSLLDIDAYWRTKRLLTEQLEKLEQRRIKEQAEASELQMSLSELVHQRTRHPIVA